MDLDARRVAAIAAGGIAGATLRWAVLTAVHAGHLDWPVVVLHIAGSIALGGLLAAEWAHPSVRLLLHDAGAIGFCGGLTTFSTFSVDVAELLRDGKAGDAAVVVVASVGGALAGVVAGAAALRRVQALTLPLEEQP